MGGAVLLGRFGGKKHQHQQGAVGSRIALLDHTRIQALELATKYLGCVSLQGVVGLVYQIQPVDMGFEHWRGGRGLAELGAHGKCPAGAARLVEAGAAARIFEQQSAHVSELGTVDFCQRLVAVDHLVEPALKGLFEPVVLQGVNKQVVALAEHDIVFTLAGQHMAATRNHQAIGVPDSESQRLADANMFKAKTNPSHLDVAMGRLFWHTKSRILALIGFC